MKSCENVICASDKICNERTGRCIKPKAKKPTSCNDITCHEGKICNPKTLRCNKVKIRKNDTKKAKKLLLDATMNDKLYFYSKSRDAHVGKGANEVVADTTLYDDLSKIKNWRKILSNFHVCPFKYEGFTYNTIEHVFQAKKIEIADKDKALYFTLESGHEIGSGDGDVARKNRKLVKLNDEQLKEWCKIKDIIMHDAAIAKYKACPEARIVLKATNNAQLWHIVSRSQPIRFTHLEQIRSML